MSTNLGAIQPNERYHALKPSEVDPKSQIQTLIRMAKADGLTPVYCFYNSIINKNRIKSLWRCGSFQLNPELFGCSIALAEQVRILGSKKFDEIAKISMPWHCAVCCSGFSKSNDDFPDRVSKVANNLLYDGFSDEQGMLAKAKDYLPRHVKLMVSEEFQQDALLSDLTFEEVMFESSEAKEKEIQGIVVISEPIDSKDE